MRSSVRIGGVLVAQAWSPQQLFWAAAVPALISTLVVVTLWFVIGPAPKHADAREVVAARPLIGRQGEPGRARASCKGTP